MARKSKTLSKSRSRSRGRSVEEESLESLSSAKRPKDDLGSPKGVSTLGSMEGGQDDSSDSSVVLKEETPVANTEVEENPANLSKDNKKEPATLIPTATPNSTVVKQPVPSPRQPRKMSLEASNSVPEKDSPSAQSRLLPTR